jgi:adenosylhomocysteine nucleosidase
MTASASPSTVTHCDAGIVFAMAAEADAFENRARETTETRAGDLAFHEGTITGRRVAWVVSGAGIEQAAKACRLLIDGHRPRIVVSAGFAGALGEGLGRGETVSPTRVIRDGHEPIALAHVAGEGSGSQLTIVTVDRVVVTTVEKRSLLAKTGAQLVDMETWGVADVARQAGLESACIRVVSDTAGQDLPPELAGLVQPQSSMRRFGAALRAVTRRPGSAADMWRLWEHAVVDARTLADALERFIGSRPAGGS